MQPIKIKGILCVLGGIFLVAVGVFLGGILQLFDKEEGVVEGDEGKELVLISKESASDLKLLETYVDYALEKYCTEKGVENTYSYELLDDMLHHETYVQGEKKYVYDLNKKISPRLSNHRFLFKIEGADTIYVDINTYRMKIYVYESDYVYVGISKGQDPLKDGMTLEDCVKCDWPDDMWEMEYNQFVIEGYKYLTTPDFEEMIHTNSALYGMVIYSLQRYCMENGIEEMFDFEFPRDLVSDVANRIFTIKVESLNRILYMDIDMDENKVHIYQVE